MALSLERFIRELNTNLRLLNILPNKPSRFTQVFPLEAMTVDYGSLRIPIFLL